MANSNKTGGLVWYDFVTRDIEKAKAFYGGLFGWRYEGLDMGPEGVYDTIKAGDKGIGGFMEPRGPNAQKVPPHWTAYVSVPNVSEAADWVKALGGTVPVGPVDIPNVGAFGVSVDKESAGISSSPKAPRMMPGDGKPGVGEFCWTELMVDDPRGAKSYYGELFGWSFEAKDMGMECPYFVAHAGGGPVAGIALKSEGHKGPSCWLSYVFVEELDATLKKSDGLGGQTIVPPMDIPDVGRFAIILDNQGGMIGLLSDSVAP